MTSKQLIEIMQKDGLPAATATIAACAVRNFLESLHGGGTSNKINDAEMRKLMLKIEEALRKLMDLYFDAIIVPVFLEIEPDIETLDAFDKHMYFCCGRTWDEPRDVYDGNPDKFVEPRY